MYARVWKVRVRPGKLDELRAELAALMGLAHRQQGYRGSLALVSDKSDAPEVTLIGVWDSLDEMRGSERNLFLMQAISRVLLCTEGFPQITEHEIIVGSLFAAEKAAT